ncbi:MAG: hypothetical protein AB7F25_12470 [Deferribacterales bacterium]
MAKNSEKTSSSSEGDNITQTGEDVKQEEPTAAVVKKIYGGPTIIPLGISKGTTYLSIPSGVPDYMHFMFLPIAEYRSTVQSASFIRKCTEAIKKYKEA